MRSNIARVISTGETSFFLTKPATSVSVSVQSSETVFIIFIRLPLLLHCRSYCGIDVNSCDRDHQRL